MFSRKVPTIPEYFNGKNVFLTGGTGFLGKVLIEKLLRSCPDIKNIYVLVRSKRNKTIEERRGDIVNVELFDVIRKENPSNLDKVKCISGDVTELKLGISEEDQELLISNVNIIYHVAASVRFDDSLRKAIIINTRSTREIIQLALKCSKLEAFMYVSTAYCNVDNNFIEEKLYTSPVNWRDAIDLAESDLDLSVYTIKYMKPWPNTYTFTKRIAEHVTMELCKNKIPTLIFRPSIVVHSGNEPLPGWIDNMNGPFSLGVAGAIGITSSKNTSDIAIYNACSEVLWKMGQFGGYHMDHLKSMGFKKTIWHFTTHIGQCWYKYYLDTLFHVALNATIDQLLKLQGKKPRLFQLVRKIFIAQEALTFFMMNTFVFSTVNFDQLDSKLLEDDKKDFRQRQRPKEGDEILAFGLQGFKGVQRFILKEKEMSPEDRNAHYRRLVLLISSEGFILHMISFNLYFTDL
nr:unnamed protein product [Callosobruchus chinensis]